MSDQTMTFLLKFLEVLAAGIVVLLGVGVIVVVILFFIDRFLRKHAIRRNYPVIGNFRYFFETLGEFFRQYFFAMDREELPFNRARRFWAYRAVKDLDNTVAFG